MKHLATLFLLLSCFSLFSQNWSPINLANTYHYQKGNAGIITHSIRVDSVELVGGDSIFHLNRIMMPCDTCTPGLVTGDTFECLFLENQPLFLNRRVVKSRTLTYVMESPGKMILYPERRLNSRWMFDSSQNISATITQIAQTSVMGIMDSVKTISLSNGREILLSKSFGVVRFPVWADTIDFEIVGLEGIQQVGDSMPDFHDFYNFQVGDVYQYRSGYGGVGFGYETLSKQKLLSKMVFSDSIRFTWFTRRRFSFSDFSGSFVMGTDSGTYVQTVKRGIRHPADALPGEQRILDPFQALNTSFFGKYTSCRYSKDAAGVPYKYFGRDPIAGTFPNCHIARDTTVFQDILAGSTHSKSAESYTEAYQPGLGRTFYEVSGFESGESENLTAYIIGGDTTGRIFPDSFFVVSVDPLLSDELNLKISPNPSFGEITLTWDQPMPRDARVILSDLEGREIFQAKLEPGSQEAQFQFPFLSPGMYLLKVETVKGYVVKKLSIRN